MISINPFNFQNFEMGGLIGLGSRQQKISDPDDWKKLLALCEQATSPLSLIELKQASIENSCIHLLSLLLENHFIIPNCDSAQEGRYSRSELYYQSVGASPSTINSNLSNASVSIIGCGGIGNHISAALATSGVGEIHIGAKKTSTLSKVSEQGARDVKS